MWLYVFTSDVIGDLVLYLFVMMVLHDCMCR